MIDITKNKNILEIRINTEDKYYTFDINSGIFYGKNSKPIKNFPTDRTKLKTAFYAMHTLLGNILGTIVRDNMNTEICSSPFYKQAILCADKIDGLHIKDTIHYTAEDCYLINQNWKDFIKYVQICTKNGDKFNYATQNKFSKWLKWERAKTTMGIYSAHINQEMWEKITYSGLFEYSMEEWNVITYYLVRGQLWEYDPNMAFRLKEYIDLCRIMSKKPNKQNNFIREYVETKKIYQLSKTKFDDNAIKENYEKKSKIFNFSWNDYIVITPNCAQDIIDEGNRMCNCVGSYIEKVVMGETYIVFIRNKNNPKQSYITCEIYPNGKISQYLLAYNQQISLQKDKEFYKKFEEHLTVNW